MRKVRIFCSDPEATDSSDDEADHQNPKKEKKLIGEVLAPLSKKPSGKYSGVSSDDEDDQTPKKEKKIVGGVLIPTKKEPSSRFRGVRRRRWGSWQVEIRNPFTKKKECSTYKTEEEAAAAYQTKREKFDAMKVQLSVPECRALSSSSSLSCMTTSMPCKQELEAHNGVGVSTETGPEPTEEIILNSSPSTKEISVKALLSQLDKLRDSSIPADKHTATDESILNSPTPKDISLNALAIPADKHGPRDEFPVSDFLGATYESLNYDYIGLADISRLPLPFKDSELNLNAEPDWSFFDLPSIERELNDK